MQFEFLVQETDVTPYSVVFKVVDGVVTASCTCRAGTYGQLCKHRLRLLSGDKESLAFENFDELSQLVNEINGSDLELELERLKNLEVAQKELANQLKSSRKRLLSLLQREV